MNLVLLLAAAVVAGILTLGHQLLLSLPRSLPIPLLHPTSISDLLPDTPYLFTYNNKPLCFQIHNPQEETTHLHVYFAGLAGSRLEQFAAPTSPHTILTLDRPGLGCTPLWGESKGTRYNDVASAVQELVGALTDVVSYDVTGWSSGGPYALALGKLPNFTGKTCRDVTTVASDPMWGRVSWRTMLSSPHHTALFLAARLLPVPILAALRLTPLPSIHALNEIAVNLGTAMQNPTASTAIAGEVVLERAGEWGFEEGEGVSVRILHAKGDKFVPWRAAVELGGMVKGGGGECGIWWLPPYEYGGVEGHMIMVEFWERIMDRDYEGWESESCEAYAITSK